ncbi:MAG: aminopeptidase [Bacteroidales bacterium]|nr:aminopeptidase [Bacteroidales bacterium]
MKRKNLLLIAISILLTNISISTIAQKNDSIKEEKGYVFDTIKMVPTTSVKDQYRSGTCWDFATISFIESEILRNNKGEYDLSEMYVARNAYSDKAINYVRFHGKTNFGQGGQAHDVINTIKKSGIVPEDIYPGLEYGEKNHTFGEIDEILGDILKAVVKNKNHKLTTKWLEAYNSVLDTYFGSIPENFIYNDKKYTPKTFAKELGINPDDYIELTSYSHHPFYKKFILEIPDNWSKDEYYNLPIDELIDVINYALKNNYTVAWDGDVSDKGFSFRNGIAIIPEKDIKNMTDTERNKWEKLTEREKRASLYKFDKPGKEKNITQEMRQENFDNYTSTDDHLMHLTGIVKDQNGTIYYMTKNSWAPNSNKFGGYLNMSESYVRLNTIAIMINKNALPRKIAKKLKIK